ncbi:hypothetical protein, partial [uncultured Marixanthomonas sp.]|uniref:DUF7507 domain-containing protein n=1 Tax=uncultured Marixanthomonas sp. TaxID=757245 RepID=UPI0030DC35CB
MYKIITKLFASDKRFLIGLILIVCLGNQGYAQVKASTDEGEVLVPYTQEYLDQYNEALDKKAAQYNKTFRSRSKAQALHSHTNSRVVGGCNLITCGSFEKDDVSGGSFRTAIGGTNGEYQADARYTCWDDNGTVDWSEGQYISYSTTSSNVVYPGIIEPSTYDGGGFAIFSFRNESIDQRLTVVPNTVYTVCFEIAVIPRYNTVSSSNNGGQILEYEPNLRFGVRNGAVVVSDPLTYTDADLVQHSTSDFPTRLSFATSGNGGNQNPGGWTEINPYWENRCITFKSGPTATSVEVFYSTGNPGESVVLVDGLRLSVEGYANSPELSVTSKTYCEPTQVELNDFVTSTTPTGAELRWSANSDLSNPLQSNPTVTTPGVWYAFYYNPVLGCTSPSRMLTLTNSDIAIAHTKENVTCYGENDGEIDITVTGGSSPYTYLWITNDGSGLNPTAEDQTGLTAGTYKVTVDDGICTIDKSIEITQPNQINVEANEYAPLCDNAEAITLTGEPTNSNGEWTGTGVADNGDGTASFDPAGLTGTITATYTYTDGNSCSNSDAADIVVNKVATAEAGIYGPLCDNASAITLTGEPTNSNGEWTGTGVTDNGDGTASFDPTGLTGTITATYTYTDGNSCSDSDTADIVVNTSPDAPISGGDIAECKDETSIQTLNANDAITAAAGTTIVWYTDATGNSVVNNPILDAVGSVTYYAEAVSDVGSCSSSERTPVILRIYNCSISLEKTASPNDTQNCNTIAPGEMITYTFKVKNLGDIAINDVEVNDPLIDNTNPIPGPDNGDTTNPGVLDVGEEWIYEASYAVTQQDIIDGQVNNTATVDGTVTGSSASFNVNDSDSVTVNLCQDAEISIVKSSTSESQDCLNLEVGNTIEYKFVVKNEGDVDISNVVITDPLFLAPNPVVTIQLVDDGDGNGVLNVGETWEYKAIYTVNQENINDGQIVNTATVDGTTGLGPVDDTSNTITIPICQDASIALIKESSLNIDPNTGCYAGEVGEEISYTFSVKNTGDVTLTNIVVTDLVGGVTMSGGPIASLDPNEEDTTTFTATYTLTQADLDAGEFENRALATGTPPMGDDVTDESDDNSYTENDSTIVPICQDASIALIKESSLN